MSQLREFALSPKSFQDMWNDQADFNKNFREAPAPTFEQRTADTKELVLHLFSECDELLRASGAWKLHRRMTVRENQRHVRLELADAFKYLISIAQVHGITADDFIDAYWEKSMAVRQRYSQEFMQTLDRPAIVVDLDNVLVDYIGGFTRWAARCGFITHERAHTILEQYIYCDATSFGLMPHHYDEVRHLFRTSGEHAVLPIMPGAREFIEWLNGRPELIVILTARPIDQYPNLYSETLQWLTAYGMRADLVWWASDKGAAIRNSDIRPHVVFAVDDEERYILQYDEADIPAYFLGKTSYKWKGRKNVTSVASLSEIITLETEHTA